jgi:hypothetical protein
LQHKERACPLKISVKWEYNEEKNIRPNVTGMNYNSGLGFEQSAFYD